ncbi:MAG TPA: hypothetical protein DEG13_03900 [Candidatus Microthrix parvicella]|nr:hypothetical protein [Candidatus Microthrix parvicella]
MTAVGFPRPSGRGSIAAAGQPRGGAVPAPLVGGGRCRRRVGRGSQVVPGGARPHALALKVAVVAQFLPGALTLVHAVPVALGVAHQAGAVVLLVVTVVAAHWSMGGARGTAGQRREAAR